MTLAEVLQERKERRSDEAVTTKCKRCAAPVLTALVGRVAALRVYADPTPLDAESEAEVLCQTSLLTWCLRTQGFYPDRLMWRSRTHRELGKCDHVVVADHVCEDRRKGRKMAAKKDPFNTPKELSRPPVKRDRYQRYLLPHPETDKEQAWQRVTTFCKITSDQFNLTQWQMRNVAVGISKREDLSALASTLDIKADAKKLNTICDQAKEAAGGTSAANTGTALHAMTESYDETGSLDYVSEAYRPRIAEYAAALDKAGITIEQRFIERIVVDTRYDVAGTFDRVVYLADGSLCVLDLKTGRDLSYGWGEIAVQLALYADAFNAHGVYDAHTCEWFRPESKVRTDFAVVVHMPAAGEGTTLHKIDLDHGREGAELAAKVRGFRKRKADVSDFDGQAPDVVQPMTHLDAISETRNMTELLLVRDTIRAAGDWDETYAAACKLRAAELGKESSDNA